MNSRTCNKIAVTQCRHVKEYDFCIARHICLEWRIILLMDVINSAKWLHPLVVKHQLAVTGLVDCCCRKSELISRAELTLPWRPLYELLKDAAYSPYEHHQLVLLPASVVGYPHNSCYSSFSFISYYVLRPNLILHVLGITTPHRSTELFHVWWIQWSLKGIYFTI